MHIGDSPKWVRDHISFFMYQGLHPALAYAQEQQATVAIVPNADQLQYHLVMIIFKGHSPFPFPLIYIHRMHIWCQYNCLGHVIWYNPVPEGSCPHLLWTLKAGKPVNHRSTRMSHSSILVHPLQPILLLCLWARFQHLSLVAGGLCQLRKLINHMPLSSSTAYISRDSLLKVIINTHSTIPLL